MNRVRPIGSEVTISQKLVRHAELGTFRRTGETRLPKAGDYFLQPASVGYVMQGAEMRHEFEILDPVRDEVR